jgi:S1-C subfamily serine protease
MPAARSRTALVWTGLLLLAPLAWSAPVPARFEAALAKARASVVRVVALHPVRNEVDGTVAAKPRAHVASGVVMDRDGRILTTATGIVGCIEIRVRTASGRELPANLLGLDPTTDLALLRIPAGSAPPFARAPATAAGVGSPVFAVAFGKAPSQEMGTIRWRYDEPLRSLLQMTTEIHPGNSGGAAVDAQGRLVGVLVGGLAEVHAADSLQREANERGGTFAIPVNDAVLVMNDLQRYGGVPRGFLGVSIQQGLVEDPGHPGAPAVMGVTLSEVVSNGPAWKAGMRSGDLVVAVNGQQVNSPDELMARIMAQRPGTSAELLWIRSDKEFRAKVSLTATPDSVLASQLEAAGAAARARAQQVREPH